MLGLLRNTVSVYLTSGDKILMLYRIGQKTGGPSWRGITEHLKKEEMNDAGAAALRTLKEKLDLGEENLVNLCLKYITVRGKNGKIRQGYYFFAEPAAGITISEICDEGILEWIPMSRMADKIMPYTAKYVVQHFCNKGKEDNLLYCGLATDSGIVFQPLSIFEDDNFN